MIKVNNINYPTVTQKKAVLYFQSYWCPACENMSQILTEVESIYPDLLIGQVDSIESAMLLKNLGISAIPALILCDNQGIIKQKVGLMTKQEVLEFLNKEGS